MTDKNKILDEFLRKIPVEQKTGGLLISLQSLKRFIKKLCKSNKEEIVDIIVNNNDYGSIDYDKAADQILDLILSKIVIEKKSEEGFKKNIVSKTKDVLLGAVAVGYNQAVDQLEEIKNKLRE